jgi:hypothetical protein
MTVPGYWTLPAAGIIPPVTQNSLQQADPTMVRPRRATVIILMLVTLLVAGATFAMLIRQAIVTPQPNRVLIVHANRDWQDVELFIEGESVHETKPITLDRLGGYTIPFFLWPGKYVLRVRNAGVEIYQREFDLTRPEVQVLDLPGTGATTRPATNPAI